MKPEKLITHEFELEEILEGFEIMRDKKEEYVKVMGEIGKGYSPKEVYKYFCDNQVINIKKKCDNFVYKRQLY